MSEADELRRRAEWAEAQLRARDRAAAEERIAAMAAQQKQQDETANAERQAALQAEIEKTRRGAWVNALLKNADPSAPFDPTAFEKAIPATGWPAGVSQSDFHFAGERVLGHEADDVGSTLLGKMLKGLERK
jgi:hypothetical protein